MVWFENYLRTDRWFHVAAVSGPSGMRLYVDGSLVGENSFPGSFATIGNNATNWIGRGLQQNDFDDDFDGFMDEIRVWRVARTGDQIRANRDTALTGNESDLVALWSFDDGTARDSSPNEHHGTLVGNARVVDDLANSGNRPAVPTGLTGNQNYPFLNGSVLELGGNGDYVEFSDAAFTDLSKVTVEGWVKWDSFQVGSRFIDIAMDGFLFNVQNRQRTFALWAETITGNAVLSVAGSDTLSAGEWVHVAATVGNGGIEIVFQWATRVRSTPDEGLCYEACFKTQYSGTFQLENPECHS